MEYPEIYGFKTPPWNETMNENVGLVRLYEKGVITKYELFSRAREEKIVLPENFHIEYEGWCQKHPEGPDLLTFSIMA